MNIISNKIYRYNEVTSTQDVAYKKAMGGERAGTVVVAESQTQGRGRLGRKWQSPKGGLYLSIILNPELSDKDSKLTLTAAECVARIIGARCNLPPSTYHLEPTIKHPNDVLLNGKKAAGILAEMKDGHLILGIGINVNTLLKDLPEGATSIFEETGRKSDNKELMGALLKEINHAFGG